MTGAIFLIIWLPGAILTRWYLLPKMDPSPGSGTQQMLKVWGLFGVQRGVIVASRSQFGRPQ